MEQLRLRSLLTVAGRFDELRVIGDKKGGYSTLRLAENPDLLASSSKTTSTDARQTPTPKNG